MITKSVKPPKPCLLCNLNLSKSAAAVTVTLDNTDLTSEDYTLTDTELVISKNEVATGKHNLTVDFFGDEEKEAKLNTYSTIIYIAAACNSSATVSYSLNTMYTVTFKKYKDVLETQKIVKGVATAPTAPTEEGAEFIDWYDEATNKKFDFTKQITADTTLCAKYSLTNTLKTGRVINTLLKDLTETATANNGRRDHKTQAFARSFDEPEGVTTFLDKNGKIPVWFDSETGYTYYNPKCYTLKLNENSSDMFEYMEAIKSIDCSDFDTSNVTNMAQMFVNCNAITKLDLRHFNTSKVTDMSSMFSSSYRLTEIDLSNFDISGVTNMKEMFSCANDENSQLAHIYVSDGTDWSASSAITTSTDMFKNCKKLPNYNAEVVDKTNAKVGGYFSVKN